jgi:tetratricopeptide (TPR) repeat protein
MSAVATLTAVACGVGIAHAQFRRSDISPTERALRRRNTPFLLQQAEALLQADPSDPNAHAIRGAAYSILGWPHDAVAEFTLSGGGEFYEVHGQHYHSVALRDAGRPVESALLREQWRVVDSPNQFAHIAIEINIVEDLRLAGAWDEALDAADFMLATDPGNVLIHANAAHLYYDMGDVDEAMFQLFLAARQTERSHRYQEVLALMAYEEGLLEEAAERLTLARKQRPRFPRLRALHMKVRCDGEETDAVLKESAYPRFANHVHPDLLAAEARCHALAGQLAEARVLVEDLRVLYPGFEATEEAAAFVEAAVSGG